MTEQPLKKGWRNATLGECARLIRDTVSPASVNTVPYIGLEHIGEGTLSLVSSGTSTEVTSSKSTFAKNDILFGKLRPYFRKVVLARFDGICSTDIWVIRPTELAETKFLFYLMASQRFIDVATRGSEGTRMPRAKWDFLSKFPIQLPPLEEQRRIARILGAFDDRIELNRRMSATLEEMARALFQSWFVNFDPVHAKAEGRPTGLPPDIDALFPATFQDSELGPIPEGWKVTSLGSSFRVIMGSSPPGATYNQNGDGLPFFQGRADFGFRYPRQRVYCTAPRRLGEPGDVLVSVRAPVGSLNVAMQQCCIGRGVAAVRHLGGSCSFTYYAIQSLSDALQRFEAEGTVFGSINKSDFNSIPWIAPLDYTVAAFDEKCQDIDNQIKMHELSTSRLVAQREALLPRLMSGELRT